MAALPGKDAAKMALGAQASSRQKKMPPRWRRSQAALPGGVFTQLFNLPNLNMRIIFLFAAFILLASIGQAADLSFLNSPDWQGSNVEESAAQFSYSSMKYIDGDVWYESNYFQGIGWCKIGKNWMHPNDGQIPALTFTAPKDGAVVLEGNPKKLHLAKDTDGVRVSILQNDQEIWSAELEGADNVGKSYRLERTVKAGDTIRFLVEPRKTIFCDTTGWDPVIVYKNGAGQPDGPTYLASNYFMEKPAADSPFSYQMRTQKTAFRLPLVKVSDDQIATLKNALKQAAADGLDISTDARLWRLQLEEWVRDDKLSTPEEIAAAASKHVERARKLLANLYPERQSGSELYYKRLDAINSALREASGALPTYMQLRILKREIALSNPLLQFGKLLFVKRKPSSYSHITMQFNGWRAQKGGGLFVLENPGRSLECRDLLAGAFEDGNVLEPNLSFDGKSILFAGVHCSDRERFPWQAYYPDQTNEQESDHSDYYHLYRLNADGSGLTQLTDGIYDDLFPCQTPDGDVAFMSTRRKGYARCFWWGFGNRWHVYTLHKMAPDGSNIKTLSWHDTNEFFPTVGHDGQIYYARWDYIDRDAVTHQNLWASRPDGTNPVAIWGNATPSPHATFQAKPVPNSRKWLFVAAAHHSIAAGPLCLLDPSVGSDGLEPIERLTPEIPFPETEGHVPGGYLSEYYDSPWPLSEDFYLAGYAPTTLRNEPTHQLDNALGLYLVDRFGNRELLYRDATLGACNGIPLAARPTPPVLPSFLPENPKNDDSTTKPGRMFITDIYQGLGPNVKPGSIKSLRVVQLFPRTMRDNLNPRVGIAGEENGRAILGSVPVETDGSANFLVPAQTPVFFQALDADGMAYQTMRTLTYLQPGEEIGCIGCHEGRKNTGTAGPYFSPSKAGSLPLAAKRAPSQLTVGPLGGRPFSFVEMVQPILDSKCVSCHGANPEDAEFQKHKIDLTNRNLTDAEKKSFKGCETFNIAYATLVSSKGMIPYAAMRNSIQVSEPGGKIGALGSRLIPLLRNHYDVKLTPEELAAFGAWIDMNAIFYGITDPDQIEIQRTGKPVPMQTLK